jgi:hypothetical protein
VKIEFDFPDGAKGMLPSEGVAILAVMDEHGEIHYFTGEYGKPSMATVMGLFTFGYLDAQQQIMEDTEHEDFGG